MPLLSGMELIPLLLRLQACHMTNHQSLGEWLHAITHQLHLGIGQDSVLHI